jgi:transcriptional regulator with XRE-family HTH domain
MKKSSVSHEYAVLGETLRRAREKAGATQVQLSQHLKQTQSYVSKLERGAVRLEFVQVRRVCNALGVSFPDFVRRFEKSLARD